MDGITAVPVHRDEGHDDLLERVFIRAGDLSRSQLIRLGELSLFASNQCNDVVLTAILSMMVAAGLATWATWSSVLAWLLASLGTVAAFWLLARRFLAALDRLTDVAVWERRLLWGRLVTAMVWSLLPLAAWPYEEAGPRFFLLMIISMHMALRVGAGAGRPAVLVAQLAFPSLALQVLLLSALDDARFAILVLGCALYPLYLYRLGLRTSARLRQMIAAQLDLIAAKQGADAASRAKAGLLAFISHEVRTPMTGILGLTQVLLDSPLDPRQRAQVRTVRESGEALLLILNDMLDLSKAEAGCLEIEAAPFCPARLLDGVVALMAGQAAAKGLDLRVDGDGMPDCLVADAFRLRQMVLNLVGNAVKFTNRGGVRIRAELSDAAGRPGLAAGRDGFLRVVVSDTGPGIPETARATLFDPFAQGGADVARRFGGSGMGLTIVKRLARAMGGDVGFDSVAGRGSDFWLRVPVTLGTAADLAADAVDASCVQGAPSLSVLVVEDVRTNQTVLDAMLRKRGHRVTLADDGETALALLRRQRFDLVLLDLYMPGMDGMAVARAIRALPERDGGATPLIATTANSDIKMDHLRQTGFNGVVAKPIRSEQLFAEIDAVWHVAGMAPLPTARPPVPSAPSLQDSLLVDHAALRDLADTIGLADLPEFVARTVETLEDRALRLLDCLRERDLPGVRRELHCLSGVAANVGLRGLATDAQHTYRALPDSSHEEMDALVADLRTSVESGVILLTTWMDGLTRGGDGATHVAVA